LAVTNGAITGGTTVAIQEYELGGHSLVATFLVHVDAAALYNAAVAAANGDNSAVEALTANAEISFAGSPRSDGFGAGNQTDSFRGMGGGDSFDGGFGYDRVSYGSAPGSIHVDLADGIVTTPNSTDTLRSIELVTGSDFNDTFDATGFSSTSANSGST